MKKTPLVIVGLGNPGKTYRHSRHNLGFMALDYWLKASGQSAVWRSEPSPLSLTAKIYGPDGLANILLKPQTFMNNSGQSVRETLNYFKLTPASLLVIHDDLDLPLGTYRVSAQAGAAGHNGVQSLIDALNSKTWLRLRLGIGRPLDQLAVENFVLQPFSLTEQTVSRKVLRAAADYLDLYLSSSGQKLKSLRSLTGRI